MIDINNLQELIDPSQSLIITYSDIRQLANIIEVKDKLVEFANNENLLKEFSNYINGKYNQENLKTLLKDIRKSTENIAEIIDIYTKKLDKNVFAEKRFNAISENGIFDIIFKKNKGYVCTVTFDKIEDEDYRIKEEKKEEENKVKIRQKDKFEEIIKDKDLLLLVKKDDSKEKKELKDKMIKIVEYIQLILEKLSIIMNKGYDEDEYNKIQIFLEREDLKDKEEFYIIKESYKIFNITGENKLINDKKSPGVINELISILDEIHKKQIEKEIDIYKKVPSTRYIYGNQFNTIYKYIKNHKGNIIDKNNEEEVLFLNRFITNNQVEEIKDFDFKNLINKDLDIYKTIEKYMEQLMNGLNKENIFDQSKIHIEASSKSINGIYTYIRENPEIDTLKCFKYLTGNFPLPQNLLVCTENISNDEIASFLFRAYLEESNSLYIIINTDKLNVDKSKKLMVVLEQLKGIRDLIFIKSLILFISKEDPLDLFGHINDFVVKLNIEINEIKDAMKQTDDIINKKSIEVISSIKPGVGKSEYIKNNLIREEKSYVYFPIGGDLNLEELLLRLKHSVRKKNVIPIS